MLQILSIEAASEAPVAGGELAARIAGLQRALRILEPGGGGPSCDAEEFDAIEFASEAARRCFDIRSERVIGEASAGLEAVVSVRGTGREPHPAAVDLVAEAIRDGLASLDDLIRR
ncbi:hypothetical protein GCM10023264_22150 [Sphingomonas daechungensis]|uniref:Hpt domain-containing protein n=1 Tax=Sphingomonas daechungensis TaxID=1176646 RepID=A0ABX6T1I4_9SPHN|nr:hypothetical protein [Sphingomonas daechungensis]QNP43702.1 hypothetical protein H9L15_03210 [Sphingomonas daechungensis]